MYLKKGRKKIECFVFMRIWVIKNIWNKVRGKPFKCAASGVNGAICEAKHMSGAKLSFHFHLPVTNEDPHFIYIGPQAFTLLPRYTLK